MVNIESKSPRPRPPIRIETLDAAQLAKLQGVDSATIANVIELFGYRSCVAGYSNFSLKAVYPKLPPAVGYAVTATFRAAYPAESGDSYSGMPELIEEAMTTPAPRIVVFQDLDEPPRAATYGEIMATTFQKFGFAGLITTGAARDIQQVERLQFPCWASSVIVSHGHCHFPDVNVPLAIGGLQVKPGDILHADVNGIINIPRYIAAAVAELCDPFIAIEEMILNYLQRSEATPTGYREVVEKAKRRMAELKECARSLPKSKLQGNL
jgi:regulator of RNase E activity RraA